MWMLERDPDLRPTMQQVQRALEEIGNAPSEPATAPLPSEPEDERPASAQAVSPVDVPAAPPAAAATAVEPRRGPATLRKRRTLIAAITVAALVIAGAVALITQTGNHSTGDSPAASGGHGASASHSATPVILPSLSASPSASKNPGGGQGTASAPATTAGPSGDRATQLTSTIIAYYRMMPGGVDQGWNWMTADYQTNHAGGRSGYTTFWSRIQKVSVSNVTAQLPSTVVATIHYTYNDGSLVVERTSFGLVFQQNQWKIASSAVLSSG